MTRRSNPMLRAGVMENVILDSKPMTIQGTVNKSLLLVAIVIASAFVTWSFCAKGFYDKAYLLMTVSAIAGLVLAFITAFRPKSASVTGPAYAVCEGLLVGTISFMYNAAYGGIVVNAIAITLLTLFSMLFLYKTRIIQATETFRSVIFTATCAIAIFYFIGFIGFLIGHPMTIFNGGLVGIGVSLVICIVAALNFILDFDFIERGSQNCAPDYFEWYGAFSLLVTVVWLYLEILRLLAQLNRRN